MLHNRWLYRVAYVMAWLPSIWTWQARDDKKNVKWENASIWNFVVFFFFCFVAVHHCFQIFFFSGGERAFFSFILLSSALFLIIFTPNIQDIKMAKHIQSPMGCNLIERESFTLARNRPSGLSLPTFNDVVWGGLIHRIMYTKRLAAGN
jgi:hypothetical protein